MAQSKFPIVFVCVLAVTLSSSLNTSYEQVFCVSDGVLPQVLYEVNLPILNRKECSRALSSLKKPIQGDTIMCAGFPDGGKDACQVSWTEGIVYLQVFLWCSRLCAHKWINTLHIVIFGVYFFWCVNSWKSSVWRNAINYIILF